MKTYTKKGDVKVQLDLCLQKFDEENYYPFIDQLNTRLLQAKVKFPLLENCATEIYKAIPESHQIPICDKIEALKTEGGNVILGILLQKRLDEHFDESTSKAAEYISLAWEWYVPDIIGERVFGWSLLYYPEKTIPKLLELSCHESNWVVRSVGAGSHYAMKKGLKKEYVDQVFEILLSKANATDYHIKTGIGWAAKTTVKFHPEIAKKYAEQLNSEKVGQWFKTKVQIGLNRNAYAKGNPK